IRRRRRASPWPPAGPLSHFGRFGRPCRTNSKPHTGFPSPAERATVIRVETSTHIDRPVEHVFAYIDDLSHLPEWIDIIDDSTASEPTTRVGTRVTNRIDLLGRHFRNFLEVVEPEPNRSLVLRGQH